MAITRVTQVGFGADGTAVTLELTGGTSGTNSATTDTTMGRKWYANGNGQGGITIPATKQIRAGGFYLNNDATATRTMLQIKNTLGAELVRLSNTGNQVGIAKLYVANTLRATTTILAMDTAIWHHWGLNVKIDASAGWVAFYVDGVLAALYEGNTGSTDIGSLWLGLLGDPQAGRGDWLAHWYIDDTTGEAAYAAVPNKKFTWVDYSADGNYKEFTCSTGSDHKANIDDAPNNGDTDYNSATAADARDTFTHATYTAPVFYPNVTAVIPVAVAKKSNTLVDSKLDMMARLSSTDDAGAGQALTIAYALKSLRLTTKPGGGAWAVADVNNAELGYTSKGTF